MLALTLAQVRASAARLVASALAVVIATAFVVATLVVSATASATVRTAVAAPYVAVDAVVLEPQDAPPGDEDGVPPSLDGAVRAVAAVPGVEAVAADRTAYVELRRDDASAGTGQQGPAQGTGARVDSVTQDPALHWEVLSAGRLPAAPGEVAVSERVGAAVGDTITVVPPAPVPADGEDETTPAPVQLRVVGVVDLGGDPTAAYLPRLFAVDRDVRSWASEGPEDLRVLASGAATATLLDAVQQAASGALGTDVTVQTGTERADQLVDDATGGALQLTVVLLVFAAVAVLVAGLVIANTFAVLLAQRTRELALLRCVGATSAQVRRGVLLEALVTGLVASVLGVGAGIGFAAAASAVASRVDLPVPLSGVTVPAGAVVAGLLVGTVVTVVSALVPAHAATRVAPLAAMRPLDPAPLRSRGGVARMVLGLLLLLPGAAVLAFGSLTGSLVIGLLGGIPTFLGVVLLCQRGVPPVVGLAGRLLGRFGGAPGRLAARNAVRTPRRTAATATALLVGVTLTATMLVGASSTRATASTALDTEFPTDIQVLAGDATGADGATGAAGAGLPAGLAPELAALDGVAGAAAVAGATVGGDLGDDVAVLGLDPTQVDPLVRSPSAAAPADGEVRVGPGFADLQGLSDGDPVTLTGATGPADLTVRVGGSQDLPVVSAATLQRLTGDPAPVQQVWLALSDPDAGAGDVADVVERVTTAASEAAPGSFVQGTASMRASLDQVLDVLLLIVTALLGIAVVIALVGVGNTLALSVVERRQESGLLRALGLPARGLRWMLLWEAAFVAGVAAVLGVLLGIGFGAAGTASALASQGAVVLDVPWLQLLAAVAVATAAGMLASVLPARRAARTPPVAAMAV